MLVKMLVDLANDKDLAEQFQLNPKAVLDKYEISKDQIQMLRKGNLHEIAWTALKELIKLLESLSHIIILGWSAGQPRLISSSVAAADVGAAVTMTLLGDYFPVEADTAVEYINGDVTVSGTVAGVTNPEQVNSRLDVGVSFDTAGTYDIVLSNTKTRYSTSLPAAIVVS